MCFKVLALPNALNSMFCFAHAAHTHPLNTAAAAQERSKESKYLNLKIRNIILIAASAAE